MKILKLGLHTPALKVSEAVARKIPTETLAPSSLSSFTAGREVAAAANPTAALAAEFTGVITDRYASRMQRALGLSSQPTVTELGRMSGFPSGSAVYLDIQGTSFVAETFRPDGSWFTSFRQHADTLAVEHMVPEGSSTLGWSATPKAREPVLNPLTGQTVVETFVPNPVERHTTADGSTFLRDFRDHTRAVEERLLGRVLSADEWVALSGAPSGATVRIFPQGPKPATADAASLRLIVDHPWYRYQERELGRGRSGDLEMYHANMWLNDSAPKGTGTAVFARSMAAYLKNDIKRVDLFAKQDAPNWVGAQVWPKLGFNGRLPDSVIAKLPESFRGATTLFELLSEPDGRTFWNENAQSMDMTFAVGPRTLSMQTLQEYLETRGLTDLARGVSP